MSDATKREDPLITQAAIAYINWRSSGGQGEWKKFCRQWLLDHAAAEDFAIKRKESVGQHKGD